MWWQPAGWGGDLPDDIELSGAFFGGRAGEERRETMTRAKIRVTLKPTVLDAQGAVVEHALRALGYENVQQVRMGKYIELELDEGADASAQVREMCDRLLANPIIESYAFELEAGR
jgi:phosphoribosylformylglycinamidine synthase subunit PurS